VENKVVTPLDAGKFPDQRPRDFNIQTPPSNDTTATRLVQREDAIKFITSDTSHELLLF